MKWGISVIWLWAGESAKSGGAGAMALFLGHSGKLAGMAGNSAKMFAPDISSP
jgi:hypothetical protein